MDTPFKWKLTETTLVKEDARGFVPPYTVSLASTAATRRIELSIDGGASWFDPELDVDEAQAIAAVIDTRVSDIRYTGAVGDIARVIANG